MTCDSMKARTRARSSRTSSVGRRSASATGLASHFDAPRVLHGLRATGDEPARAHRARAGGRAPGLRLGLGGGGVGNRLRERPRVARRDHGADQARERDHADPRSHAGQHGDDRGDSRSPLGRALSPRPRDERSAGRRGLARRAVGEAAREDARVRRHRPRGAPAGAPRAPRRSLRHPTRRRHRSRQAAQAHGAPAPLGDPDLSRRHAAEGGRPGVRDRGRLAPHLLSPEKAREAFGGVLDGAREGFDVAPAVPAILIDDAEAGGEILKPYYALYVGGVGARGENFYNELFARYGYEAEAKEIQDLYLGGNKRDAAAKVPDAFVDEVALVGSKEHIAERLDAWRESGATTLLVSTQQPEALRALAEIAL